MMLASRLSFNRFPLFGCLLACILSVPVLAKAAAPVPPPPPLPGGAQVGGQPGLPPPTIPIPETNIDLTVPPVYDRPLGADEGARVFVKKFVITGVVGDRKAGINPEDIQAVVDARFTELEKLAEQERLKKQNLDKQDAEGFTPDEHDKIIKFMQGAVKTASPDEQQKQYQEFIQQLMLERLQRLQGLTIGELQQVADLVTKYYHDKGYFLARAVIPAQEIKDGVVNIRVLEGRLEKVQVAGNKRYSDDKLQAPFKPLIGELVTVDRTENALLTLSQYPGLSAAGVFHPGTDVGTTDIVVNVQKETPFDGNVRVDNSGTDFTGRERIINTLNWNNPTGAADLFRFTALKTFNPPNSWFGDLRYERPMFGAYNTFGADISKNSFDVTNGLIHTSNNQAFVHGISKIGDLSLEHDFFRTRQESLLGTFDLSRKRADTFILGNLSSRDDLAVLGYQLDYNGINSNTNTISTGYVRVEHGLAGVLGVPSYSTIQSPNYQPPPSRKSGSSYADPSFNRLTVNYQIYKNLPANQGLLFRVGGQYSPDLLTSLEQYVIGGPDNVRGVPSSQFLMDKGGFGSIEYSVAAPGFSDKHAFGSYTWGQVLRFKVFTDSAFGLKNKPQNATEGRQSVTSTGIGLEFTVPGTAAANLQWAHLNGGSRISTTASGSPNLSDPNNIKDSSQLWFDITFNY